MRSYPRNSPEAAARILALLLVADGHVCSSETATLEALGYKEGLDISDHAFQAVMQSLCEDLYLACAGGAIMDSVNDALLESLLAEIDEPALQRTVLRLATAVCGADNRIAEAESRILEAARRCWDTAPEMNAEALGIPGGEPGGVAGARCGNSL